MNIVSKTTMVAPDEEYKPWYTSVYHSMTNDWTESPALHRLALSLGEGRFYVPAGKYFL